jgi:hypothetical protein
LIDSQPQQREKLGQTDQPFGLISFLRGKRLTGLLPVEKRLQSGTDSFRQSEPGHIGGEIDFKGQGHGNLRIEINGKRRVSVF